MTEFDETHGVPPETDGEDGCKPLAFIKNDAGGDLQGYWEDVFPTMRSEITPAVARRECFGITPCDANGTRADRPDGGMYVTKADTSKTLTHGGPNTETVVVEPQDGHEPQRSDETNPPGVGWRATVRRLLPVETERLMGFPDNWTRIPWKGKPAGECPDAPRYKACGNSMAVNVMRWIGIRIGEEERRIQNERGGEHEGGRP